MECQDEHEDVRSPKCDVRVESELRVLCGVRSAGGWWTGRTGRRARRVDAARRRRYSLSSSSGLDSMILSSSSGLVSSCFMKSGTSSVVSSGCPDLVEVVHPAGELGRNGSLGTALFLLKIGLRPSCLSAGQEDRSSARAGGAAATLSGWTRPGAKSARTRCAETATAGTWRPTEAAAAGAGGTSVAAAGTRGAAAGSGESTGTRPAVAAGRSWRSTWSAILASTGFADSQRTAHEELAVELLNSGFRHRAIGIFNEREASRAAGFAIEGSDNLRGLADGGEMRPQIVFCGLIREIPNEQSNWWHGIVEGGKGRLVRSRKHSKIAIACQARLSRPPACAKACRGARGGRPPTNPPGRRPAPAPVWRVAAPCRAPPATSHAWSPSNPERRPAATRRTCSPSRAPCAEFSKFNVRSAKGPRAF